MLRRSFVVGAALCLAWALNAQAQGFPPEGGMGRGGGPGAEDRGRFEEMRARMDAMNALNIEATWAVLSFEVELVPGQLDSMKKELDQKVAGLLDKSQYEAYSRGVKAYEASRPRPGGPGF